MKKHKIKHKHTHTHKLMCFLCLTDGKSEKEKFNIKTCVKQFFWKGKTREKLYENCMETNFPTNISMILLLQPA